MIDLDPQGNATMGSGVDKNDLQASSYHWLMAEAAFVEASQASPASYQVMPSNIDLTAAEVALLQHNDR
jgi:chromosome partitioning protein